ncbi:unnamed protein product, partial [Polarella glacialis]
VPNTCPSRWPRSSYAWFPLATWYHPSTAATVATWVLQAVQGPGCLSRIRLKVILQPVENVQLHQVVVVRVVTNGPTSADLQDEADQEDLDQLPDHRHQEGTAAPVSSRCLDN